MKYYLCKTFIIIFCLLTPCTCPVTNFPEDFTSLDRVSYSSGEILLTSYYLYNPKNITSDKQYDYKNGIQIHPFNQVIS